VNGNGNIIVAFAGCNLTINGTNDAADNPSGMVTVQASDAALMVENGGIETVDGNNDQIAQVGPTDLTLTG
jgi:hypothetical protein